MSVKIRLMMLFNMVPRKVFMPNTSAQSSLVSDEAIWKLGGQRKITSEQFVSVAVTRPNVERLRLKLSKSVGE